jgi:hypothetical protein
MRFTKSRRINAVGIKKTKPLREGRSCGLDVEPQAASRKSQQGKNKHKKTSSSIGAGLCIAGLLAATSAQANLVLNGGFQGGTGGTPTDWTLTPVIGGTVTAVTLVGAPSGDAAEMFAKSSQYYTSDFYQNITLPTGPESVSFWVDVPSGGGTLSVNFSDATPDLMDTGINAGSGWQQYNFIYTPTDPTVTPTIEFDWNSASQNIAYIDNVSVTPVPEPTTMVAGAMLLLPFWMSTLRMLRKSRVA